MDRDTDRSRSVTRRALLFGGIQLGGMSAPMTDIADKPGLRRGEEELAAGDQDGLAGIFREKIGDVARRFRDGCEPDFAAASLAELFAWCVARGDACRG